MLQRERERDMKCAYSACTYMRLCMYMGARWGRKSAPRETACSPAGAWSMTMGARLPVSCQNYPSKCVTCSLTRSLVFSCINGVLFYETLFTHGGPDTRQRAKRRHYDLVGAGVVMPTYPRCHQMSSTSCRTWHDDVPVSNGRGCFLDNISYWALIGTWLYFPIFSAYFIVAAMM